MDDGRSGPGAIDPRADEGLAVDDPAGRLQKVRPDQQPGAFSPLSDPAGEEPRRLVREVTAAPVLGLAAEDLLDVVVAAALYEPQPGEDRPAVGDPLTAPQQLAAAITLAVGK